ncbi:MAG TPA: hypothetical protein VKU19_10620, partial [Bryobacteraceae bacterium]|nr:hypothetical protein [Bryobacteraceae bacterium]
MADMITHARILRSHLDLDFIQSLGIASRFVQSEDEAVRDSDLATRIREKEGMLPNALAHQGN